MLTGILRAFHESEHESKVAIRALYLFEGANRNGLKFGHFPNGVLTPSFMNRRLIIEI